jgi:hypothetical protein
LREFSFCSSWYERGDEQVHELIFVLCKGFAFYTPYCEVLYLCAVEQILEIERADSGRGGLVDGVDGKKKTVGRRSEWGLGDTRGAGREGGGCYAVRGSTDASKAAARTTFAREANTSSSCWNRKKRAVCERAPSQTGRRSY